MKTAVQLIPVTPRRLRRWADYLEMGISPKTTKINSRIMIYTDERRLDLVYFKTKLPRYKTVKSEQIKG